MLTSISSLHSLRTWTTLIALALGGCETPPRVAIPPSEAPYELKHETKALTLDFSKHQSRLSEEEHARFLSALKPGGPGKVSTHLTLPAKAVGLGRQRLQHLIRTAVQAGLKPKQIHRSHTLPKAAGNGVFILLDTYRAIPPLCPHWPTAYGTGYGRGPTSNFGCATATNFLLMIDDPIILFKGEKGVSRDAARDALAIADFRAGKDKGKWLRAEKTDGGSSQSSGSSGAGGAGS